MDKIKIELKREEWDVVVSSLYLYSLIAHEMGRSQEAELAMDVYRELFAKVNPYDGLPKETHAYQDEGKPIDIDEDDLPF